MAASYVKRYAPLIPLLLRKQIKKLQSKLAYVCNVLIVRKYVRRIPSTTQKCPLANAKLENGLLTINLPKKKEKFIKGRQIDIN